MPKWYKTVHCIKHSLTKTNVLNEDDTSWPNASWLLNITIWCISYTHCIVVLSEVHSNEVTVRSHQRDWDGRDIHEDSGEMKNSLHTPTRFCSKTEGKIRKGSREGWGGGCKYVYHLRVTCEVMTSLRHGEGVVGKRSSVPEGLGLHRQHKEGGRYVAKVTGN
jgi:hypothetical protein